MTDDTNESEKPKSELPEFPGTALIDHSDWFLSELVELAQLGVPQWITLDVGAGHINGQIISGREYFEQLAKEWENVLEGLDPPAPDDSLFIAVPQRFRRHMENYLGQDEEAAPIGLNPPSYIHLKNAQYFNQGVRPFPGGSMLWRGKISAVDGFSLGRLEARED